MKSKCFLFALMVMALLFHSAPVCLAAYDLEVPVDPWEEYRLQFRNYSRQLLKSYDRAFMNDYEGAVREAGLAIEILPEEGLAYAERGKYYRILNSQKDAERDFRMALTLFDQAIRRYRPDSAGKKLQKGAARKVDPADSALLVATLRYQRGEAYFSQELYRQAWDDFGAACENGNQVACARLQDVEQIEKRGVNWVPLSMRQFYDKQRIERISGDAVRVWLRREDPLSSSAGAGQETLLQQLELRCDFGKFRLLEQLIVQGNAARDAVTVADGFDTPAPGSATGKLMIMFCSPLRLK